MEKALKITLRIVLFPYFCCVVIWADLSGWIGLLRYRWSLKHKRKRPVITLTDVRFHKGNMEVKTRVIPYARKDKP